MGIGARGLSLFSIFHIGMPQEKKKEYIRKRRKEYIVNWFKACLVDCNKYCNLIIIFMVQLFFSLVIFLLSGIIIPYEQLFFKMKNNYSSLSNSYSIVGLIISKINIFLNKQIFPIHITIIKIINHKNLIHLSLKFKKILI